jgi:hypothetical protein
MSSFGMQRDRVTTVERFKDEITSLIKDQERKHARELVFNERAITALEKEVRTSDQRIQALEKILNMVIDAQDRNKDDIEKLTSKVDGEAEEKDAVLAEMMRLERDKETRIRALEKSQVYKPRN